MSFTRHSAYASPVTLATTGLNSLANNTGLLTAAIDNSAAADRWLFDDLELFVEFLTPPVVNQPVDVFILPAPDGTNYASGDGTTKPPLNLYVGSFHAMANANDQYLILMNVPLPPGFFKYVLWNSTGVAFESAGNTLKRYPHTYEQTAT